MTAGSYQPGMEQEATTASGSDAARGAVPAEQHALPGVVVHRRDPGRLSAHPDGPGPVYLQPGDQRAQRGVLAASVRQPGAGGHPRRHPVRGEQGRAGERNRAETHPGQRRQRAVLGGQRGGFASAGPWPVRAARPRSPRMARGSAGPRPARCPRWFPTISSTSLTAPGSRSARRPARRSSRPRRARRPPRVPGRCRERRTRPIRTEHHSSHRHLRNHSRRRQLTVGCAS